MLVDQLSLTHLYWVTIITGFFTFAGLTVRWYFKYRVVRESIRKAKPKDRAEILRATAEVLREQRTTPPRLRSRSLSEL